MEDRCLAIYVLNDDSHLWVVWEDLYIGDGEDADAGVPLPLVPVVVHLLLDVDDLTLAETELTTVLCLETEQSFSDHLAISGLLSGIQENGRIPITVLLISRIQLYISAHAMVTWSHGQWSLVPTCYGAAETSDLGGGCRDASWTPGPPSAGSPWSGQCSCRTCRAASSASS